MTALSRASAVFLAGVFTLIAPAAAHAQISVSVDGGDGDGSGGLSSPVALLLLFGLMGVLPAIVIAITAFPRILIVLGFVRQAMGTMTVPPTQVLVALALFLTMFVMMPTVNKVREDAVAPYIAKEISFETAWERGQEPVRSFMFRQTRTDDLALFVRLAKTPRPETRADIPTYVLIPAFMISELKTAFQIGFMIYLPFLIIDMVVASTLLSVGMMMLPPPMISLPFKLLLFVLVNGWHLVIESLVNSFNTS